MSEFTWYLALLFVAMFLIIYLNYVNINKRLQIEQIEQKINSQSILKSLTTALNDAE